MDVFMYIWRVKTSLRHWTLDRVAFMPTYFFLQIEKAYLSFTGNLWIAVCVNFIEKIVEVFGCLQGRNRQYVEKFSVMIPRIVKAVAPPENKKYLLEKYYIVEVPLKARLNKSLCDCGAYALKNLECQLLGLDLNLVDDEIIQRCCQKIALDIWEAKQNPILIELMTQYVPSNFESSIVFDLVED
ncbi:unnamed protein product [Eruca vesicaria subsp. sativa]|uniref:Ubiquitin-like protease family profile domain-containing protein n=1 Tax=Eruca vesicaria subsp. sativa TaxID=29727 RepID=A0ABC8K2W4_ERUVS|nr:unnamed protein product [Eruca vesicaria subsp. sativa]